MQEPAAVCAASVRARRTDAGVCAHSGQSWLGSGEWCDADAVEIARALVVRPTDGSHRVTTLELFFDLVFVFALTQVTALMAEDPTVRGLGRGLVLLALLWFGWSSYAWLGNQAKADEGLLRAARLAAMGALFVVALAIPESYEDEPGGLYGPFVLAACYATVRIAHLVVYLVAAGDDHGLRRQLLVQTGPTSVALLLLVAGGAAGPPWQSVLWALALVVDYIGVFAGGTQGWRVNSAAHFAERHGLIIIVALGESVVAVGAGIADKPVTAAVVLAALLGLGVSVALWWVYFDVVALVAERVLSRLEGEPRSRLARDSFTYLHFPMLVGIVYLALGMKKVLTYVADPEHHDLGDALPRVPLVALFGGAVLYLVALSALRRRNVGGWNVQRLVASAALLALLPVGSQLPAIVALGALLAVLGALIGYEAVVLADERDRIRHAVH
jgi:low temperature requirement protein LtrA